MRAGKNKLTPAQYQALKLYEGGEPRNETQLKINNRVYENLSRKGFVARCQFLQSLITDRGRAALADYEAKP